MARRAICLDTETTGITRARDRLCEVAAIEFDPVTFKAHSRLHLYLNPECPVSWGAQQVHGLTNDFLAPHPVFREAAPELIDFIRDADLYMHNAAFDAGFLNAELARAGLPDLESLGCHPVCTLKLARRTLALSRNRLDDLCRHFGISLESRTLHGAMIDTELLLEVVKCLASLQPSGAF